MNLICQGRKERCCIMTYCHLSSAFCSSNMYDMIVILHFPHNVSSFVGVISEFLCILSGSVLKCFPWKCVIHVRPSQRVCHLHRQKQLTRKHKNELPLHFKTCSVVINTSFSWAKEKLWGMPAFPRVIVIVLGDWRPSELHWFVLGNRWGRQCNRKNDRTWSSEGRQEDRNLFP